MINKIQNTNTNEDYKKKKFKSHKILIMDDCENNPDSLTFIKFDKNNKHTNLKNRKKKFKKWNTKEIKKITFKEKIVENYYFKDNEIKEMNETKNNLLFDNLNKYEGESRMSEYDIINLINPKDRLRKFPSIKTIKVNNLKSFLNQNLKLEANNRPKHKRYNSIKINFNIKTKKKCNNNFNNQNFNQNFSNQNFSNKNSVDLIKTSLKEIDDLKIRINKNSINFKNKFESMNSLITKKLKYNKDKVKIIKNSINKHFNFISDKVIK